MSGGRVCDFEMEVALFLSISHFTQSGLTDSGLYCARDGPNLGHMRSGSHLQGLKNAFYSIIIESERERKRNDRSYPSFQTRSILEPRPFLSNLKQK